MGELCWRGLLHNGGKSWWEPDAPPNHHADKETHMGHVTYLRPQGYQVQSRSKKVSRVGEGGWAQEPTLESLLRKRGTTLLVGAWSTLCAKALVPARSITQRAVLWAGSIEIMGVSRSPHHSRHTAPGTHLLPPPPTAANPQVPAVLSGLGSGSH